MGIQRIQRELRCPAMEKTVVVTIASGYAGLVIPSDMIELIDLVNSQGDRITKEDITTVKQLAKDFDWPRYYYRQGGVWLLGPAPTVSDTVTLVYYAELGALVNPTDTNVITQVAGDLIVYAGLGPAGDFYSDRRSDKWEARYTQILGDLQGQADDDELSGGACVSPAFFYPDPMDGGESFWNGYPVY
jgi:hypothetical protein